MKRVRMVSCFVLLLAALIMAVNWFLMPLPDWAVRVDGMLMLLALPVFSFTTIRCAWSKE